MTVREGTIFLPHALSGFIRKSYYMRIEEFKMERQDLLKAGDPVTIVEKNTVAFYYYTIVPALAMSGNFSFANRIKSTEGTVKDIRRNEKGYFVDVEFDEEAPN